MLAMVARPPDRDDARLLPVVPALALVAWGAAVDVPPEVTCNATDPVDLRGNAVVEAEIFGCGRRGCGSETDSETVELQR